MYRKKTYSLISHTIFILISLILPLNIISIVIMEIVIANTADSISTAITSNLKTCVSHLDRKIDNTNYLLYTILKSDNCKEYLKQADDWTHIFYRQQVYQETLSDLALMDAADSIYFYLPSKEEFLFIDNREDLLTLDTARDIFSELPMDGKWHLCDFEDSSFLIRSIAFENGYYGAFINCRPYLPSFDFRDYSLTYSSSPVSDEKGLLLCSVHAAKADFHLTFSMPRREINGYVEPWKYLLLLVLILCLLIIPILFSIFRKNVSHPLNELNQAHYELQTGNENYRITAIAKSTDFSIAYQAFNSMAQNLQLLQLEKTNRELAYRQMQLNNLRLQIRPHFLLNTMNLLYTLVQSKQTEAAQELILYLSQYFRYMFRNGKELDLFAKELNLIKKYLHISKIHYPDAFTVSYQIDPTLYLLRIPPLLFHNFIENITQHALLPNHVVHIIFFGEYDNKTATFQISDDGCGMEPKDVEMINSRSFPPSNDGRHIGIRNSIARLDYYYHNQASITVESELNGGTTFTITIPCNLDENSEDEYETINCE